MMPTIDMFYVKIVHILFFVNALYRSKPEQDIYTEIFDSWKRLNFYLVLIMTLFLNNCP